MLVRALTYVFTGVAIVAAIYTVIVRRKTERLAKKILEDRHG